MGTSIKLFKIHQKFLPVFHANFLTKSDTHEYANLPKRDSSTETISLKLRIDPLGNKDGTKCNCMIDIPESIYNTDEGEQLVKISKSLMFRTFRDSDSSLLAIFAPKWLAGTLVYAISLRAQKLDKTLTDSEMLVPVRIDLNAKEAELQKEFLNVRRFFVKDVQDVYVKGAAIRGVNLQNTKEYDQLIHGFSGKLMSLMFEWNATRVMVSSDGRIFTYKNFESDEQEIEFARGMIKILKKLKAL